MSVLLDQRVTVTRQGLVADGYGGQEEGTETLGTIFARIDPVRGQERELADRQAGVITYRVTVRNKGVGAGLRTGDVLTWRGTELRVQPSPQTPRAINRVIEAQEGVEI